MPNSSGDDEWPAEVEEVRIDQYGAGDALPPPRRSIPAGDAGFGVFANHLWLALGQVPMMPLCDDVTSHMVSLVGLVREGGARRVLFDDPSGDGTFLEAGRNTFRAAAKRYIHGYRSNVWSVTVDELSRFYQGGVIYHPNEPVRRAELKGWYLGHDVLGDRVVAHVHGPDCSFQLELDSGFVAAREERGLVRWDVLRDDGYSLSFETVSVPPHVASRTDDSAVFSWYLFGWAERVEPERPAELAKRTMTREYRLVTGEVVRYAWVDGVPDPGGQLPLQDVFRVCGGPAQLPEPFVADPIPVSDHIVYAVLVRRPSLLVFALRGHREGWTPERLRERLHRIMLSLLSNT